MASEAELEALHRAADIPDNDETYPDDLLAEIFDDAGSVAGAAAIIWREKAAALAGAVDVTESGSSRKLGDLSKNALAMAAALEGVVQASSPVASARAYTIPVERL
jgi:hypothetical protein